jgi:hypothetical protein
MTSRVFFVLFCFLMVLRGPSYQGEVSSVCGFTSITSWILTASNLEETNLTSKLRIIHGPRISRITTATR